MKIYTVTLNPALDRTMYFGNGAKFGILNRASAPSVVKLGGKGMNVSCVLKLLGIDSTAYGFVGGDHGDVFLKLLEPHNIKSNFTRTKCCTRMNIKIIGEHGESTEFNEAGGPITPEEKQDMLGKIESVIGDTDFFFMGGSAPQGISPGIYRDIIKLGADKGAKTKFIADCDGEALKLCMAAEHKPFAIKPNHFEIEQYTGKKFDLKSNFKDALARIEDELRQIYIQTGVIILCTLGEYGGLYCGEEGITHIRSPKVDVKGFTGAGDTFLTAFIAVYYGLFDALPHTSKSREAAALSFAVAASTAKVTKPGTEFAAVDEMVEMYKRIAAGG